MPRRHKADRSVTWRCGCGCGEKRMRFDARHRERRFINGHAPRKHNCCKRGRRTPEYITWVNMVQRCTNPNHPAYKNYGARGISVCDRWLDFEQFLSDMGLRPPGKTLDRFPNNDGNYEPSNCRWATRKEQRHNSRQGIIAYPPGINRSTWRMRLWRGKHHA